jgi:lethal(2) giant larvae protein
VVTEKEGFMWKGHKALELRAGPIKQEAGFQPVLVLQITPPASVTSLSLARQWGVLAAGTAHGVVVLDYQFQHVVTARSTLSSADIANADDAQLSRKKSLKKSLRESFRRLRKGRNAAPAKGKEGEAGLAAGAKAGQESSPRERAPLERQVEARGPRGEEDGLGSMVRCLHFASTYIASTLGVSPTLWAGTNTGQVLVFLLTITPVDKRKNDKITAVLAKEIQLKHRAPVIDIEVHDAGGLPVSGGQPSYPAPHRVLITSEEQFKLFLLPQLKPCGKYKLTAHEGIRVRRVKSATFTSARDPEYTENCLVYLANSGEIGVLSLPELRRQVRPHQLSLLISSVNSSALFPQVSSAAVRKEDVVGISSLSFSDTGNGIYLSSSSELQQISLSARHTVAPGGGRVLAGRAAQGEGEGDTDSQADRQNRQNEREAGRGGGKTSPRENGDSDPHNETAVSEVRMVMDILVTVVRPAGVRRHHPGQYPRPHVRHAAERRRGRCGGHQLRGDGDGDGAGWRQEGDGGDGQPDGGDDHRQLEQPAGAREPGQRDGGGGRHYPDRLGRPSSRYLYLSVPQLISALYRLLVQRAPRTMYSRTYVRLVTK